MTTRADIPNHAHATLESMSMSLWYNQWTLAHFDRYLTGDILEIGSGIGTFTRSLAGFGPVWAIDIDGHCVSQTRKIRNSAVHAGFGDIEKNTFFFRQHTFDSIICLNVLEHIRDDARALKNMYALLNPGGVLILLVPAHPELLGSIDKAIGHYRRYTKSSLIKTVDPAGFSILSVRRLNFFGALGWWFSGKILKQPTVRPGKLMIFNLIAPVLLPVENFIEPPLGTSYLLIAQRRAETG